MNRDEILAALWQLGELLTQDVEITVAGGAALIVAFKIDRGTADVDAVEAVPRVDQEFRQAVQETAELLELNKHWLNDSAKGFADVLAPDFRKRRLHVGNFNRLRVYSLGRRDLILMKLFAMRAQDLEDLGLLAPSKEEIGFVRENLERLGRIRADQALRIRLYLEQGEGK
ncbi:MAG: hypothetical protein HY303_02835 [Candidatus Wallbacteria bacterium]|nr:hypothetical protein [Candidatus Wallbacteria bacterium]